MKKQIIEGHWLDQKTITREVVIGHGEWTDDENDFTIFYYTDNETIKVGDVIAGDFKITKLGKIF